MPLNIAHINVRSLPAHFNNIKNMIAMKNIDILAISETWLTHELPSNVISIPGYNLYRNDRLGRGGGVAFYCGSRFHVTVSQSHSSDSIEYLWLRILGYNKDIYLGVFYRPPKSNFLNFFNEFEDTLSEYSALSDFTICMGDFNINLFNINESTVSRMLDLFDTLNMTQLIESPTRVTATSSTLLDLLVADRNAQILKTGTFSVEFSDHYVIHCKLNLKSDKNIKREFFTRTYKYFDYDNFAQDLYGISWQLIYDLPSADLKIGFLNSNILHLFNKHAPLIRVSTTRPPAPWLTYNIRLMMKSRDEARKRYQRTRNQAHFTYYKSVRNEVNRAIGREKRAYFAHRCRVSLGNRASLWKEYKNINPEQRANNCIPDHLSDVEALNVHFASTVTSPISAIFDTQSCMDGAFEFRALSETDILLSLGKLKTNAYGVDGINAHMLKICVPLLMDYILHVFNFCIERSTFPDSWKSSLIRPLPKTSSPEDFKDLRPISLLPALSKVFERCIENQLRGFICDTNALPEYQSGFRSGYGCATALTNVVDDILKATDNGEVTVLVLLDFSKAFDTIHHDILLEVLGKKGLAHSALQMIKSYLKGRTQRVKLNNNISSQISIKYGVPQGAILSPLLFCLYTSNLPSVIKYCKHHLYADDTQMYLSFKPSEFNEAQQQFNEDLNNVCKYCDVNQLYLNPLKTQAIVFGPKHARISVHSSLDVRVRDIKIVPTETVKNLGLCIDSLLRFKQNTSNIIKKAVITLKSIFINRKLFDTPTRAILCNTLVLSHFNYADVVYDACLSKEDSNRIQRVQNSCTRLIYGMRGRRGVTQMLKNTGTLNMSNMRQLHGAMFFINIIKYKRPSYLYSRVRYRYQHHTVNTRYQHLLTIPKHRHEIFKRSFSYNIARTFNSIMLSSLNLNMSKLAIKKHLKQQFIERQ